MDLIIICGKSKIVIDFGVVHNVTCSFPICKMGIIIIITTLVQCLLCARYCVKNFIYYNHYSYISYYKRQPQNLQELNTIEGHLLFRLAQRGRVGGGRRVIQVTRLMESLSFLLSTSDLQCFPAHLSSQQVKEEECGESFFFF